MQRMDYPLTHAQKRIWYTEQFYPGTSISNLGGFAKLKSEKGIDHRLLMEAVRHVVAANESMRLRMELDEDGEVRQHVAPYEQFDIEWFDYSDTGDIRSIMEWTQSEVRKPFLLYGNRLFHFAVFTISTSECWFFAKVHHLIADGISIVLLGNQIVDHYLELIKGNADLPMDQPSYTAYMETEAQYEKSDRFQKDKNFWNAKYESVPESVSLKRSDSYRIHTHAVRLSKTMAPALHREIQAFCDKNSVSPLALFLSVMFIYMQRLTGQQEVTVGTFMGNRTNAKEKQMLGMFVSTIPMKAHIDEQWDFLTFVRQNMKELIAVIRHQKYPYDTLINDLRENHGDLKRLFGLSLEYQVMQWMEKEDLSMLVEPIFSGHEINDISIHVKDRWDTGTLNLDFDYRAELFTEEEMEDLYVRIMTLLEDVLNFPEQRIADLALIPKEEQRRILTQSKHTEIFYDREITLDELFQRQAINNPLCTAVRYEGRELTYQELNEQAIRLGGILRKKAIGADVPVAIVMERTEKVIIAILGILKAGGAYVPIDPGFPEERIRFIIEDSGAKVIITEPHLAEKCDLQTAEVFIFDDGFTTEGDVSDLTAETGSRNLAYIIYTSGTTGKPKGVMIEHRQVHHLIEALRNRVYANYVTGLNVALLAPFHFDASVQQIFASLLLGHTLHIVPRRSVSDGRALADYYRKHGIEVTDGTPSHLKLLAAAEDLSGLPLRHMLIGGEALPSATVGKLFERLAVHGQAPTITNVYGPTESCVDASAYDIVPGQFEAAHERVYMPIGKPLGNNRVYIMDANARLLPFGVEGELYIAGDGVGRGYLNLPDLTSDRFVADPFVSDENMYKTGDLAHWLPDGNLAFAGRIDDQVKIRGYRIELGEIEAVLQQFPGVGKAVVLARPAAGAEAQSEMELCAYVVRKFAANPVSVSEIKAYLSQQLPDYMLPPYFVEIEEIPLTSSGKVDRKALLRHEVTAVGEREYVAPTNALEAQLGQIWQDVLGVERVGIFDNFFEMGGHSLKAMTLLSRTHKACGVEVPLQVLFATPTVYAIAKFISDVEPKAFSSIERAELREGYPLSLAQRRIYIVSQLGDAGTGYNMPATALIEGNLDVERLEQAFGELVRRHESLRTSFISVNGVPMQKVHDKVPFQITVLHAAEEEIESIADAFVRPFELSLAPLMRVGLMELADNKHLMLFDMHHLISDGVSIGILLGELAQLYAGHGLPKLPLQYKDYAVWQNEQASNGYGAEEEYWLIKLGGELPVLQLLTDYPRPSVQSFQGDRVSVVLGPLLKEQLNRLAEQNNTTLYTVLLSAYYILLARYTGQEDIVIGTPTAGRNHADLEGIVGMFVQTLAIRAHIDLHRGFTDFLRDLRSVVLEAFDHPNYPFERLAEKLVLARDLSRNPIFDTLFSLQNAFEELPDIGGLRLTVQETNFRVAKFDLTLQAKEEPHGITLDMDYSVKLFRKDSIERILDHYVNLLRAIVGSPEMRLAELNLLGAADKTQLLMEFNPAATEYPKDETIVRLFEAQVAMQPDRTALAFEGDVLRYSELNEKANQLARILRSEGVQNGATVAVLVDRSMEMIIGILAILKAGAAYVPIDPEHPVQRIKHFLTDSGASVLLTQRDLTHLPQEVQYAGSYVLVDDASLYHGETSNLDVTIAPGDLANLTYTSGTTGTPKGNMVTHANILRTVKNANYMEMTDRDVVLALSNYVFDAFMFDVFGALLNGAKLVLIPKNIVLDISRLPQVIERENITILMITTALFNLLVDIRPDCLGAIRKVLFGGERASVEHVRKALKAAGQGKLLHMYGPSESTVFATYYPVDELADDTVTLPIGKPVSNTTAYIFDSFGQLQPIGAAGELYIGGDGLVLGYFNRPELTAEKFVCHPFKAQETIYRTGDLARWLPDGNIEFIGRMDHQVKIRGQRVELGEIEQQLLRHEAIREAVVLAVDAPLGDKRLCAYVVADVPLTASMLRDFASKELPGYMVPSAYIQLEQLPLTGNGKVDRRALPKPDALNSSGAAYMPPRTDTEARLVGIWQEVLGIPQIGVQDHFFELGGHSLKAMEMLARIHRDLQVELPLKELFQSPTIAGLAQAISKADKSSFVSITPAEQREVYPVTSAQKRLYVLQQLEGAERSYNMPCVMRLDGPLHRERFKAAIQQLLERHDALRTSFEMRDGQPVQRIRHQAELTVSYEEATEQEAKRMIEEFVRPFDLEQSPLFRTGLIRIAAERHLLLVDMHHIISDGASVSLLLEEITKLYAGEKLEPLRLQYKDYAVWQQHARVQSDTYRRQETYWLEQLSGELPVLELPMDEARPAVQSFAGDRMSFSLDPDLTVTVRNLAQKTETTLYMVLLASYSAFLAKLSGQSDIIVGSPSAGRSHPDLAPIMGMFVHTFAVRTCPEGDKRFADYLQEVKQTVLEAYENQHYPFEELVGKLHTHRDMSRNPLFDVVFGMQNADLGRFAMEGLNTAPYPLENRTAKFDMTLTATEAKDTIRFELEYNTALFHPETISRWIGYFKQLLSHVAADPEVQIARAAMLTESETQRILMEFNETATDYPRHKTIHELFEEQTERVPDNMAVVVGDQRITYRELNARANKLARLLREKGLHRDNAAGIMVEPSVDMMVGVIAILKAGGAYLPIDPDYPEERVRYLLADSGAGLVLTQRAFAGRLEGTELLYFDDPSLANQDTTNLARLNEPEDLAYVMYTSGSTGQPKGVMVEHRNVVRLVKNAGYIPLDETCRMAQTGAISFDASTFEFFGALLNGGTLYPVPKLTLLDVEGFSGFLQRHHITTMWLTSPLFNQLAQEQADMFAGVRDLIIGGDALVPRHVNRVRRVCPDLTLWNGYGPTENTTFSTCFRIEHDYPHQIPIGKPIGNSTAYILNAAGHPQPIGIPGELCVGGDGVVRGYWNRPELTEEKFVDNPFSPGDRMYRTGDLAQWLPDGHIEFLGRIDQQVKVRGFRIELGEIESQMIRVDGVNDAVVVTRQDEAGANSLCAYVAADRKLSTEELRRALSKTLPAYMVPSYFVQVEKMPLTPNGKVDRKALPEPVTETGPEQYRAPRNEKEELLCQLWQDVLAVTQVGINDNFFSLGGDSIKAIQLAARLNKHGWKLEMKHLFQHPTIEQVHLYLQNMTEGEANQAPVEGEVPLTPIQRWFFDRRFTGQHHWNQAVMLHAPTGFKTELVQRTLSKLVEHHDALRMGYAMKDGNVVQFNRGPTESIPQLEVIRPDVWTGEVEQAILLETERIQASIDLTRGPLLNAALFQTDQGDHLLIVIHHLVVDGVSWRILLEDFAASYVQADKGDAMRLPDKTHSYREWAARLQDYADSRTLLKEIDYWRQLEQVPVMPLPKDHETNDHRMRNTSTVQFSLTAGETKRLTTRVHDAYHTEINDILLTALGLAARAWTGNDKLLVNLEGHGREEIIEGMNISRTAGWFTTQYPVMLELPYDTDPGYQIKKVKEDLRHIPHKGIGYGLLRYLTDDRHKSGLSFSLAPEISFNYLGQFAETAVAGLFRRSTLSIGNPLSPETERLHPIDIVGAIEGDVLNMTITYNSLIFDEPSIVRLGNRFKTKLLDLMEHCLAQEERQLTPSDLGDDELTLEELDSLLEIL